MGCLIRRRTHLINRHCLGGDELRWQKRQGRWVQLTGRQRRRQRWRRFSAQQRLLIFRLYRGLCNIPVRLSGSIVGLFCITQSFVRLQAEWMRFASGRKCEV